MKRTFEIDFDDIAACKRLINLLRGRVGELKVLDGQETRADRKRAVFDACNAILETDISHLYKEDNDLSREFYVYAHVDPSKKIAINKCGKTTFAATLGLTSPPIYIGKGTGLRAYDLNRNETHRKIRQKLLTFGTDISVHIVKSNMTSAEALALESKLIDIFGLIANGGRLANLDEGHCKEERRFLYSDHLSIISQLHKNSA